MPAMLVVPFAGAVATAMLDQTPETELVKSIAVPWLLNATLTLDGDVTVGATEGVA